MGGSVWCSPLGQEYQVNGGLSYQFKISYNSRLWDIATRSQKIPYMEWTYATQDPHSNAGLGWILTFGQLYGSGAVGNTSYQYLYVGPDGGEHFFYDTLHNVPWQDPAESAEPNYWYTRDGSYLRLHATNEEKDFDVESPDGTWRHFHRTTGSSTSPFQLQYIRDRYGNQVTVNVSGDLWTISDPHRTHYVKFTTVAGVQVVDYVLLAAFGDSAGPTAKYQFHYGYQGSNAPTRIEENCRDDDPLTGTAAHGQIDVPLLTSVDFPRRDPNDAQTVLGAYRMPAYYTSCSYTPPGGTPETILDLPGVIQRLALPTLGQYEWTYQTWVFPARSAGHGGGNLTLNETVGVRTKRALKADGTCAAATEPACTWTYKPIPNVSKRKVVVTDPAGDQTVNYLSQPLGVASGSWTGWDYGLPIDGSPASPGAFVLSQQIYQGLADPPDNTHLRRSIYLAYEHDRLPQFSTYPEDWYNTNRRVVAQKTVYHDDGDKTSTVTYSDFDGLGHFRQSVASSGFAGDVPRTERTVFNLARGTYEISGSTNGPTGNHTFTMWPASAPWVLGTFTEKTQSENGVTAKQEFCFDADTGFLQRVRTLASGTQRAENDLLVVHSGSVDAQGNCLASAGQGNVRCEEFYGGDVQGLTNGQALCSMSLPTTGGGVQYRIKNSYAYGSLATSYYDTMNFYTANYVIDSATGLIKQSTDTAGVKTDYFFDRLGRITLVDPEAGADALTKYTYTKGNATNGTTTRIDVEVRPNKNQSGADLTASRLVIDLFGRIGRKRRYLADGNPLAIEETWDGFSEDESAAAATENDWSTVDYVYDALGRTVKVSTEYGPGVTKNWTVNSQIDAFGRPGKITAPDLSFITFAYSGDREVRRTVKIGTSYNPVTRAVSQSNSTTTERYDRAGRLYQVEEPSGANDDQVTTTYSYDVGGRLKQVATLGQVRNFTYDNRGFLLSEQHPEKGTSGDGTVNYASYDARGHAGRKWEGPQLGEFDLLFAYDRGERLTTIKEKRITPNVGQRLLKEFIFGNSTAAADRSLGKLKTAKRHNWVLYRVTGQIVDATVTETYTYGERGGRISSLATALSVGYSFTQGWTYNELGKVATTTYPDCDFSPCESAAPAPPRTVAFNYTKGLLSSVPGYATAITSHSNAMLDTITFSPSPDQVTYSLGVDPWGMKRIAYIRREGQNLQDVTTPYLDYYYDGVGNVVRIENEVYPRDLVSRVKEGDFDGGYKQTYTFDAWGNMTSKTTYRPGQSPIPQTFAINGTTNRISGVPYDAAGNQTRWGVYNYEYDAFGMMRYFLGGGNDKIFVYTAGDERIWELDYSVGSIPRETFSLRDLSGQVLRQYRTENGQVGPWTWVEDWVYRDGKLLSAVVPGEPGPRHFFLDHLGSPRVVTKPTGGYFPLHTYFPFGEELNPETDTEKMKFTGHERDMSLAGTTDDLDYMHARYCSPITARFLIVDTHEVVDLQRDSEEDRTALRRFLAQPQSWNQYAYVKGNPLSYIDPDGEEAVSATTALVFGAEAANAAEALSVALTAGLTTGGVAVVGGGAGYLIGTGINAIPGVSEGIQSGLANVLSGEIFRTRIAETQTKIGGLLRQTEIHLGKIASAGGPDKDPDHRHHQKEIKAFLGKAKNLTKRLPPKLREQALKKIEDLARLAGVNL